jgi:hypothetical protein
MRLGELVLYQTKKETLCSLSFPQKNLYNSPSQFFCVIKLQVKLYPVGV